MLQITWNKDMIKLKLDNIVYITIDTIKYLFVIFLICLVRRETPLYSHLWLLLSVIYTVKKSCMC